MALGNRHDLGVVYGGEGHRAADGIASKRQGLPAGPYDSQLTNVPSWQHHQMSR